MFDHSKPICQVCTSDLAFIDDTLYCPFCSEQRKVNNSGRVFETGAYRDTDSNKFDYEGFLSPLVIRAYGEYMHEHRTQSNGEFRSSDNWQRGIPKDQYMKSAWRHFLRFWASHRGYDFPDEKGNKVTQEKDALAILFNVMGYFHESLKKKEKVNADPTQSGL